MNLRPPYPGVTLRIDSALATAIGLNESIVLHELHRLLCLDHSELDFDHDDHKWIKASYAQWRGYFPWWSEAQIKRTLFSLEDKGFLLTYLDKGDPSGRKKLFRLNYQRIEELEL